MRSMPQSRLAIVPGSFDPLTNGHVDLIERAAELFDRVVVGVLVNASKQPMFSADDRIAMVREVFVPGGSIEVDTFQGLLVDYARQRGAVAIVKGLRGVSDFDYETQMALMNRHLQEQVRTVFLPPSGRYAFVSSRLVKEVAALGGAVHDLVPSGVAARLAARRLGTRTQRV